MTLSSPTAEHTNLFLLLGSHSQNQWSSGGSVQQSQSHCGHLRQKHWQFLYWLM